jgi:SAM-dependent MidA family methyltransferase
MTFSNYMNEWLYGNDGYYTQYKAIGKKGDFYTSVSSSKFFGGTLAKYIIKRVDDGFIKSDALICEIGAHHGYLLADIVEFIFTLRPELLQTLRFGIVERYEALQTQQKKYFEESFGNEVVIEHYFSLTELKCDNAFFIANEIFDAFACELFYKGKTATVVNNKIVFENENEWVSQKAAKYHKDRGEIAVGYELFAKEMMQAANTFEFISFDYGEMSARPDFSIRVYKEHEVYPLFDENISIEELYTSSDITYDVTFEHVKDAFVEAGATFVSLKAQMSVLVDMGILDLLEILRQNVEDKIYKQELEKVKFLIMPDHLGERFKMITLIKE